MRKRIAHGLAVFFCVASLGAAQGNSGSDRDRPSPTQPRPAAATKSKASNRSKPYQVGTASWYGSYFEGKETASGEPYNMYDMTAAHPTLPLGTFVKVTNLRNGKAVVVRVNDRGPVVDGRIIDVSYQAAQVLGMKSRGIQRVRLDVVKDPETVAFLNPLARPE
jgi:rare lipoprotein A